MGTSPLQETGPLPKFLSISLPGPRYTSPCRSEAIHETSCPLSVTVSALDPALPGSANRCWRASLETRCREAFRGHACSRHDETGDGRSRETEPGIDA